LSSLLFGRHSANTVPLLHAMIASPSRLPELALNSGVLNARIVSRELAMTAAHCSERVASHESSGSVHAAG
jgi:hypothetical protein